MSSSSYKHINVTRAHFNIVSLRGKLFLAWYLQQELHELRVCCCVEVETLSADWPKTEQEKRIKANHNSYLENVIQLIGRESLQVITSQSRTTSEREKTGARRHFTNF